MRDPNKKYVYSLEDLTSDEKIELGTRVFEPQNVDNVFKFPYIRYDKDFKKWLATKCVKPTTNAKELFYTLENIQVDCRDLSEGQIEKVSDIYHKNKIIHILTIDGFIAHNRSFTLNTITYDKFMELFSNKEENFKKLVEVLNEELTEEAYKGTEYEVKYIAEKPKQYQIGIDTFNPQPHYNNENGSLYKIANDLGLNHWEFDIFKRLVRCRKKNQFKEDLQKIKDTIDIYLNEYSE